MALSKSSKENVCMSQGYHVDCLDPKTTSNKSIIQDLKVFITTLFGLDKVSNLVLTYQSLSHMKIPQDYQNFDALQIQ